MDVFQGPNIPLETFQSPVDLIILSNISILIRLRKENDSGNVFMAFIAESYGWAMHWGP